MENRISLIVAMARNRTIGRDNDLPWHLPEDLKYFKGVTTGKPVIMGRKTFDSILARIGKPLPGRPHYIVSRSPAPDVAAGWEGVHWCPSLEVALAQAATDHPSGELIVMGGASIYEQALPKAGRLYLTVIDADVEGDAWFPVVDPAGWQEIERRDSQDGAWRYSFLTLDRI